MVFSINTSSNSVFCAGNLYNKITNQQKTMQSLSSGIRLNSASDNAANLSLSKKISSLKNGYAIAQNNSQTAISFLNTVESSLSNMASSLQKLRELSVQAANGVYSDNERKSLQSESTQISENIKQLYKSTTFNETKLFESSTSLIQDIFPASTSDVQAAGYDSAHIITNASEFVSKISADLSGSFILMSDIDMSSLGTLTTSAINTQFDGKLDGNGYTVNNLSIDTAGAAINTVGLFTRVGATGSISNLGVEGTITASNTSSIGLLTGNNAGTISNSYTSGTISGGINHVGGFAGYNTGSISKSYTSASVLTTVSGLKAGGFVGTMGNGAIKQCYSTGVVVGNNRVGGFIGGVDGGTVSDSYSVGNVTGQTSGIGGFAGYQTGGSVTNCYTTSDVNAIAGMGGFFGSGTSTDSFYINNLSSDPGSATDGNIDPLPTSSWDKNIWDFSGNMPTFNSIPAAKKILLQIGADSSSDSHLEMSFALSLNNINFDITNSSSAKNSIDKIDELIEKVNEQRSNVGIQTKKLNTIIESQNNRILNYASSDSTIKDTDMAEAVANLTKQQILQNSTIALQQQFKNVNKNLIVDFYNSMQRI